MTGCVLSQQRLIEYQRRLDISSLKQSENPMILELKVGDPSYIKLLCVVLYRPLSGQMKVAFFFLSCRTWT